MSLIVALTNQIRSKGKIKTTFIAFVCFSLLFLMYQLTYYTVLNNYQSEQNLKHFSLSLKSDNNKGYRSLKDIAYDFEQNHKKSKDVSTVEVKAVKGDVGTVEQKSQAPTVSKNRRGKPIFSDHILGAAPEAQKFYSKQNQKNKDFFSCFTSGKLISWDKVNDDFCDCPSDGSDEPSTNACMNGRFFCTTTKKGYPGKYTTKATHSV